MVINLFDIDIYYINLPDHSERNSIFLERMRNAGFDMERVHRIEGIRKDGIPQDGVFVGCFHSQLKALKIASSKGYPFMILEDDVVINSIPDYIEVPDDSEVIYTGISAWGFVPSPDGNLAGLNRIIYDRVDSDVVRIFNMLSSHSIMYVGQDYTRGLIKNLEENIKGNQVSSNSNEIGLKYYGGHMLPCDVIMANQQYLGKAYGLRNPVFYQDDKHKYCTLIKI